MNAGRIWFAFLGGSLLTGGWDIFQRHWLATGEVVFRKYYSWHLLKQEGFYRTLKDSSCKWQDRCVEVGGVTVWSAGNCRPFLTHARNLL
jgi:hypothetical protein